MRWGQRMKKNKLAIFNIFNKMYRRGNSVKISNSIKKYFIIKIIK